MPEEQLDLHSLTAEVVAVFGGIQVVVTGLALFLGRIWINRIHERDRAQLAKQLNALRAERERDAAIFQAAIHSFTASHSAAHERRLAAVREVWQAVVRIRSEAPFILTISDVTTRKEHELFLTGPQLKEHLDQLDEAAVLKFAAEAVGKVEEHRPFVSPALWSLFEAYRTFVVRAAWLFLKSKQNKKMEVWFEDPSTLRLLGTVFSEDEQGQLGCLETGRFRFPCQTLEGKILAEAQVLVSGEAAGAIGLEQARSIVEAASAAQPGQSVTQR